MQSHGAQRANIVTEGFNPYENKMRGVYKGKAKKAFGKE